MSAEVTTRALEPFGLEVTVPDGAPWSALDVAQVHAWVAAHRVLVIRGLAAMTKPSLPLTARALGPLQPWEFGAVNELVPDDAAKNYLYTRRAVPLHWDGAFAGKVPRYLFFQCLSAGEPDAGGETVFVDTTRVWRGADAETRDRWRALTFAYETDRVAHYGGRFTARVVSVHPHPHEPTLRFAEPVDDVNPVHVSAVGLSPLESAAQISSLRASLDDPSATLRHAWRAGDVVIADNHALLHGRRAFSREAPRHLRRVNVHDPGRGTLDAWRDSLRIRRPEFMVAEAPILLLPMLWVARGWSPLGTWTFAEAVALFALLFHFGDMVNCLADRDLDAVYKTRQSEAVYGLGVRNVTAQIAVTVAVALALAAHLAWRLARWEVAGLVVAGLALGHQYSYGPVRAKSLGVLQVPTLAAVIFVGPMLLVATVLTPTPPASLLALIAGYAVMQQGLILVNTAEDLPEDTEACVRTAAVSLGASRCLALSVAMVALGGALTVAVVGRALLGNDRVLAGAPLLAAWAWALTSVVDTWRAVRVLEGDDVTTVIRPRARWMPAWIAATAWGTLLAAWAARAP